MQHSRESTILLPKVYLDQILFFEKTLAIDMTTSILVIEEIREERNHWP
jgi:hypothetical protein